MRFRVRFAEQVVGVFILVAIVGLAAILILIGVNQRWFAKNYYFQSEFISGTGLSVGGSIQFRGFDIGKISAIDLNERNTVDVEFYVYDTYYEKMKRNSVLELVSSPLGLGGGLIYHPGIDTEFTPPEEGYFIPALDTVEGRRRIKEGLVVIPKSEDMISSLLGQIDPILGELDRTIAQVNSVLRTVEDELAGRGTGPVSTLLTTLNSELDGSGEGSISQTLARINAVVDTVQYEVIANTTERLNSLLDQLGEVTTNVIDITADVAQTTESLRDPTGIVPKLLGAKGSIPTLLDDDNALYDEILAMLTTVAGIVDQLKSFTEFVNGSTPQISGLIEKGQDALDGGVEVITAIKNNPLLRGGIPEAREQPTTFQSMRDVDF